MLKTQPVAAIKAAPQPITFIRKTARNRGNSRIWIEGKKLTVNGLGHGRRFDCEVRSDRVILTFCQDGERKVAGNPERPIIDINTGRLNNVLNQSHYLASIDGDTMTITPCTK